MLAVNPVQEHGTVNIVDLSHVDVCCTVDSLVGVIDNVHFPPKVPV